MRVIVTGGAGFIGSALVRYLVVDQGHEVLTIDKLTYAGRLASLRDVEGNPRHHFLRADICDAAAMRDAIERFRPNRIMHLAAESHVDRSLTAAADFVRTNIVGTFTLLDAALNHWRGLDAAGRSGFRFLHVSTDEVFGSLGATGYFTEESGYDPSSPYSASKAASDHLVRSWQRSYGLPVVITNCSNNYGPYHFPEKLIPLTILNALANRPLSVYGRGENVRDWLFVDDHARALETVVARGTPGRTYNVGGGSERRNIDVVRAICAILDEMVPSRSPRHELIRFVTDRPGHDARYAINASRLENELGWRSRESFESGLRKTVRWYLDNEWWWGPLWREYGGERLGLVEAADRSGFT